jgi:hypothetical protein
LIKALVGDNWQLLARAASWCACMAWRIGPPRVVVEAFVPQARAVCRGPRPSRSRGELAWDVVFSCEVETCRARRRLVVRGGDLSEGVPLVGNWSKMLPTGREHDVLPVRVLTGVLSPPRLESWPSRCQSWPSHCQWCRITLC